MEIEALNREIEDLTDLTGEILEFSSGKDGKLENPQMIGRFLKGGNLPLL